MTCDHPIDALRNIAPDPNEHPDKDAQAIPMQAWCESCAEPVRFEAHIGPVKRRYEDA